MTGVSVVSNHSCHLGEGPSWHAPTRTMFWFDVLDRQLLEMGWDSRTLIRHDLPFHGTVAATVDAARQLIAGDAGLFLRDIRTGALTELMPFWDKTPGTRANDGRTHPSGALWISTMSWTFDDGLGTIWCYRDGEIRPIITGLAIPNAICFSPDGRRAYYSDSKVARIYCIDVDPATGLPLGEGRVFAELTDGGPDGAVVDADGLLWNARWNGAAVDAYATDGQRVQSVALPAKQTSCPCFVGPDLDHLLVTSAREFYDADKLAADPLAGQTFLVTGSFKGKADPAVRV
ncbi:SMP-30/gluconolactonase/LRE family protein [Oryzibacter oryziterrae]|uniref:SMP-30/gluconolactonase/LRE family protein n=1 Tax=Oryzibacter oryziterrae TaxID=2766474 RepID=UPI001F4840BF|nr:SMP-30/gluconolactonase/LRE family protein [Oryzibacter oryziterrae]